MSSTPEQPPGTCGRALSTGKPCPDHPPQCAHESWDVTGEHRTAEGWHKTRKCNDCAEHLPPIVEAEPHWDIQPAAPAQLTHEGPDPSHGGLTTHRGRREDCTGPDCAPDDYRAEIRDALAFNTHESAPVLATLRDALLDDRTHTPEQALAAARILLAAHARELAAQTETAARERNREMRERGDRARVATCAGMRVALRLLTEHADRLDAEQPADVEPRTERSYWQAIADALNAANAAGMPVGIDLDGVLTDHNAHAVVWDFEAERWTLTGYDDEAQR